MRLRLVPQETNFDFFRFRNVTMGASLVLMAASIVLWLVVGLNFGIDFRGGTSIRTEAVQPIDVGEYRQAVAPLGLGEVSIVEVFDPTFADDQNVAVVSIQAQEGEESATAETVALIKDALTEVDPSIQFTSVESVGPEVSGELIQTAVIAVLAALGAILVYIWLRFEWQFSVGAVAALFHDVILTMGMFALTGFEFNLATIAALLTIVGYSMNDTVIVFDRVREEARKYKKLELFKVVDLAINATMSRTLLTSGTTLLALLSIFLFGGPVLRGMSFALIFGVVVGTYSSIFVASAVVLLLGIDRGDKPKREVEGFQGVG